MVTRSSQTIVSMRWNHTWNEIIQHMIRHTTQRVIRWITELTILFLNTINFEIDFNRGSNPVVAVSEAVPLTIRPIRIYKLLRTF